MHQSLLLFPIKKYKIEPKYGNSSTIRIQIILLSPLNSLRRISIIAKSGNANPITIKIINSNENMVKILVSINILESILVINNQTKN